MNALHAGSGGAGAHEVDEYELIYDNGLRLRPFRTHIAPVRHVEHARQLLPLYVQCSRHSVQECAGMTFLGHKGELLGFIIVARGDDVSVHMTPSLFMRPALAMGWKLEKVIVGHTHLKRPASPTREDELQFLALVDAMHAAGIEVMDYVIVAPHHPEKMFHSYREAGSFD